MAYSVRAASEAELVSACERLRFLSLLTVVGAVFIAAALALPLGVRWSPVGSIAFALITTALAAEGVCLRHLYWTKRLAVFCQTAAIGLTGTIAGAAVAMVALRSGAPMADSLLASVDSSFGLHAQSLVAWVARWDVSFEPLRILYNSAFPEAALSLFLLSMLGRAIEAWRLTFLFIVTLLSCAVISFAAPAYGSFIHAAPETVRALPPGAGTFWWDGLNHCRNAEIAVLGINDLGGVVAFPSFHTIIALLTIQAWYWNRWLRVPVIGWNVAMLSTTLPIGGHYFVDLVAGAGLWLAWSALADRVINGFDMLVWRHPVLAA